MCVCVFGGGGGLQSAYLCDTQGFLGKKNNFRATEARCFLIFFIFYFLENSTPIAYFYAKNNFQFQ